MVLNSLDILIQEILDGKNIPKTDQELRGQLAHDLRRRLLDRINHAVISAVPEERLGEFERMIDMPGASEQQVQTFIMSAGIDLPRIAAETMQQFKNEYLTTGGELGA